MGSSGKALPPLFKFDAYLPQHDRDPLSRKLELAEKRKNYEYAEFFKEDPKK